MESLEGNEYIRIPHFSNFDLQKQIERKENCIFFSSSPCLCIICCWSSMQNIYDLCLWLQYVEKIDKGHYPFCKAEDFRIIIAYSTWIVDVITGAIDQNFSLWTDTSGTGWV